MVKIKVNPNFYRQKVYFIFIFGMKVDFLISQYEVFSMLKYIFLLRIYFIIYTIVACTLPFSTLFLMYM
jgi:hypothetical protein